MNLLFVCSGNTCRSPLAMAAWQAFALPLLQRVKNKAEPPSFQVSSAGFSAEAGAPASPYAVEVARFWDIDLASHRARSLSPEIIGTADLICPMTAQQTAILDAQFPDVAATIRPLGWFAAQNGSSPETGKLASLPRRFNENLWAAVMPRADYVDILDPYGSSLEAYYSCAVQVRRSIMGLAGMLSENQTALQNPKSGG